MRRMASMAALLGALALAGATSPLATPGDYVFTRPNVKNAIEGVILGASDYMAPMRAEDVAYAWEAYNERLALGNGKMASPSTKVTYRVVHGPLPLSDSNRYARVVTARRVDAQGNVSTNIDVAYIPVTNVTGAVAGIDHLRLLNPKISYSNLNSLYVDPYVPLASSATLVEDSTIVGTNFTTNVSSYVGRTLFPSNTVSQALTNGTVDVHTNFWPQFVTATNVNTSYKYAGGLQNAFSATGTLTNLFLSDYGSGLLDSSGAPLSRPFLEARGQLAHAKRRILSCSCVTSIVACTWRDTGEYVDYSVDYTDAGKMKIVNDEKVSYSYPQDYSYGESGPFSTYFNGYTLYDYYFNVNVVRKRGVTCGWYFEDGDYKDAEGSPREQYNDNYTKRDMNVSIRLAFSVDPRMATTGGVERLAAAHAYAFVGFKSEDDDGATNVVKSGSFIVPLGSVSASASSNRYEFAVSLTMSGLANQGASLLGANVPGGIGDVSAPSTPEEPDAPDPEDGDQDVVRSAWAKHDVHVKAELYGIDVILEFSPRTTIPE